MRRWVRLGYLFFSSFYATLLRDIKLFRESQIRYTSSKSLMNTAGRSHFIKLCSMGGVRMPWSGGDTELSHFLMLLVFLGLNFHDYVFNIVHAPRHE